MRIGLLGCGNVGAAFAALVAERADAIEALTGLGLQVSRIAVRSVSRDRGISLSPDLLTHDAAAVVSDPAIDLVVEVMGGIEPARTLKIGRAHV